MRQWRKGVREDGRGDQKTDKDHGRFEDGVLET